MKAALRESVVPNLRARGFKGSFPHFTRQSGDHLDLLTFQFSMWGPDLYVEVATAPANGITYTTGEHIPPQKVRVRYASIFDRKRLGATPPLRDHTFDFGPDAEAELGHELYETRAREIAVLLDTEAEPWWRDHAKRAADFDSPAG
jgi:hypothetical protein